LLDFAQLFPQNGIIGSLGKRGLYGLCHIRYD
jgi:hypothetical protein